MAKQNSSLIQLVVGGLIVSTFWFSAMAVKLSFRLVRLAFRAFKVWIKARNAQAPVLAQTASKGGLSLAHVAAVKMPTEAEEVFQISNRIHTAELKHNGECVGHLWLYTYDLQGTVHRVVRINDAGLREAIGSARIALKNVPYHPERGEEGIEAIKKATLEKVQERFVSIA